MRRPHPRPDPALLEPLEKRIDWYSQQLIAGDVPFVTNRNELVPGTPEAEQYGRLIRTWFEVRFGRQNNDVS